MIRIALAAVAATLTLAGSAIAQPAVTPAVPPPPLIDWDKIQIRAINLETTIAIEKAVTTGLAVRLPLQSEN